MIIFTQVLTLAIVDGQSMEPTYKPGAPVLINRLSYLWRSPGRGEVVAIKFAGRRLMLLKRVVGLPGETVRINSGQVYINETGLPEPYLVSPWPWDLPARVLVSNEYFVIGDNRRQTMAEHFFGRVYHDQIAGRALW